MERYLLGVPLKKKLVFQSTAINCNHIDAGKGNMKKSSSYREERIESLKRD